jgi:hypothetical protein
MTHPAIQQIAHRLIVVSSVCTASYGRLSFWDVTRYCTKVPSRLVLIYFYGDRFPDDRPCPRDEAEWRELIRACHLTLGLPEHHKLSDRMHEVFLPALVK